MSWAEELWRHAGEEPEATFIEMMTPLLEALDNLAQDRSEGVSDRCDSFLWHRLQAKKVLKGFVDKGGKLP